MPSSGHGLRLAHQLRDKANPKSFQPANITFDLLPALESKEPDQNSVTGCMRPGAQRIRCVVGAVRQGRSYVVEHYEKNGSREAQQPLPLYSDPQSLLRTLSIKRNQHAAEYIYLTSRRHLLFRLTTSARNSSNEHMTFSGSHPRRFSHLVGAQASDPPHNVRDCMGRRFHCAYDGGWRRPARWTSEAGRNPGQRRHDRFPRPLQSAGWRATRRDGRFTGSIRMLLLSPKRRTIASM